MAYRGWCAVKLLPRMAHCSAITAALCLACLTGCGQSETSDPELDGASQDSEPADTVAADSPGGLVTTTVLVTDVARLPVCGVESESVRITTDEAEENDGTVSATVRLVELDGGADAGVARQACRRSDDDSLGFARQLSNGLVVAPVACEPPGTGAQRYRWAAIRADLRAVSPELFLDWTSGPRIVTWDGLICGPALEDETTWWCRESEPAWGVVWELPVPLDTVHGDRFLTPDGHLFYTTDAGSALVASKESEPWQLPPVDGGGLALCEDGSVLMVERLDDSMRQIVWVQPGGDIDLVVGPYSGWHQTDSSGLSWPLSAADMGPYLMTISGCDDFLIVGSNGTDYQLVRVDVGAGSQTVLAEPLIRYEKTQTPGSSVVLFSEGAAYGCAATSWFISDRQHCDFTG